MFLKRFFSFFLAFSCLSNLVLPNLVVNASKPPRNPFSLSQANSGIPGSNYPAINPNFPPQIIPNNFNRQNDQQRMSAFRPAEVVQITGPNNALVNTLLNANQNNNIINNQNINAQPNVVLPIPLQLRPQNTDRQFNNINQNANMQQQTRLTQRVTSSGSVARMTIFPQTQNGNNWSGEVLLQNALPQEIEENGQPYNNLNNNFDNLSMISTRTGTSATEEIDLLPFIIEDYRMWRDQGLNRRQAFTKLREKNGCSQEFLDQNSAQIRLYDNCEGFEEAYKQKLEELKMLSCKSKGYEIKMFLEDWPEECYDKVEVVIDCFKKAGKIENVNTRLLDISYMIRDFYNVNTADEFIKFLKTRYADEILMRSLVDTHDVRKVNAEELTELDKFTVGSPMILVRVHNVQDFAFPDGLFAKAFRTFAREQGLTSANGNMEQVQQE